MPGIVAVVDDLFFMVKIMDAAKREGLAVTCVKDESRTLELARENPSLIVIDLNSKALNAVDLIQKLKQSPATCQVRILAFVSHVQIELRAEARQAGADVVLPRSTFSQNLPSLLRSPLGAVLPGFLP